MKCFYHSSDLDGHCSGALIKMAYPDCELIGINYGDEFPWETIESGEKVFMVDFCLQPFSDMGRLARVLGSDFIWIDHHKSAIEESVSWNKEYGKSLSEVYQGRCRNGGGACQLVWEYLIGDGHFQVEDFQMLTDEQFLPTFIKLLAEYDVWNHSDPRTLAFQFGMRLHDTNPENQAFWKEFFDVERVQQVIGQGGIILKYQKAENKKYCDACAFEVEFDGLRCLAINKMLTNSQLFDSAWDPDKYDAMLAFGFRDGKWTVSLYSDKDDIDVSAIAKERGGGGHKGAAGFQCDALPFGPDWVEPVFKETP